VTALQTLRAVTRARATAAGPPTCASLEMTVEMDAGRGGLEVRFDAPCRRPTGLERAVAASLAATSARLPEAVRDRLEVELGHVRSVLRRDGGERPLLDQDYRLASCRGVLLEAGEGEVFRSPWTGSLEPAELDPSLPLVLGASAVLALLSYALEVTGSHVDARSPAPMPDLTVIDTAASPYPPQHHPFASDGAPSPDRPLIEEGRWRDREEHAGEGIDPLFVLLTRPDRALRPLAAATHFNRRNLAVRCARAAPLPAAAVLVDSWRVRVGPRGGAVPFHAELSRLGPDGERLAVSSTVGLRLDPWEVLAHVAGACGPPAPAVDADPIEGDSYGSAPPLVTGLLLADLVEGR
jgi:hypothetical protein